MSKYRLTVIPGLRAAQNPDCAGRDAGANIREANGPEGALQDAARISSFVASRRSEMPDSGSLSRSVRNDAKGVGYEQVRNAKGVGYESVRHH
jgi:hypothetical protein